MAGGWTRDGAVQDQIDDTVKDAVEFARAGLQSGEGADECDDCGEAIPAKRRAAFPGTRTGVGCQSMRDQRVAHSAINRRGCTTDWHTIHLGQLALSLSQPLDAAAGGIVPRTRIGPVGSARRGTRALNSERG